MSEQPIPTVHDLDGNRVEVGDRVAYAAGDGDSAGLRIGTVERFQWSKVADNYRGPVLKMRVDVDRTTGWTGTENASRLIEVRLRRFVKVA